MNERKINLAICGCGNIAAAHILALQKIPEVRIYALWNRKDDFAAATSNLIAKTGLANIGYITDDLDKITGDSAIDAVYITTTHNDRVRLLRACAQAGKPVFMEKPLALHPEEFQAMQQILKQYPILFQSGYKLRFNELMIMAKKIIPDPQIIYSHVWDNAWSDSNKNTDKNIGGGHILCQGVYAADAMHYLAGSPPVAVSAITQTRRHRNGLPDCIVANFSFANGTIGSLTVSDAGLSDNQISKFFVEIAGGGCSCSIKKRFTELSFHQEHGEDKVFTGCENGFLEQSKSFVAAVINNQQSQCSFWDGVIPSMMIFKAFEAAAQKKELTIDIQNWLSNKS